MKERILSCTCRPPGERAMPGCMQSGETRGERSVMQTMTFHPYPLTALSPHSPLACPLTSPTRYLNKMLSMKVPASQLPENIAYLSRDFQLKRCPISSPSQFGDPQVQLELYEQRARRWVM